LKFPYLPHCSRPREVANDDNDAMINVLKEERRGEEREVGTCHGVANDEEEEPEDREKTRSRRRHYPR